MAITPSASLEEQNIHDIQKKIFSLLQRNKLYIYTYSKTQDRTQQVALRNTLMMSHEYTYFKKKIRER